MASNFEEAKQLLLSQGDEGTNLFDHLSDSIHKMIVEKPHNAYGIFESLSDGVKQSTFTQPTAVEGATPGQAKPSEGKDGILAWANNAGALFEVAPAEDDAAEPVPTQDLPAEANLLEWAGVSFGREETFRLHKALQRLAAEKKARQIRFWGKISCTKSDYYIAQGQTQMEETDIDKTTASTDTIKYVAQKVSKGSDAIKEEPRSCKFATNGGSYVGNACGLNKHTYWVCKAAGEEWTELPIVTSATILAAQKVKKMFTGNLDEPVVTFPPFPGDEKDLLRAQIARISAATIVVPAGYFAASDEDGVTDHDLVDPGEDFEAPQIDALRELEGWQHYDLEINSWGRSLALPEKEGEEEEPDEDAPEYPEAKPVLQPIGDDEGAQDENNPIWQIRVVNKKMAVVRHLSWPGAYAVGDGERFVNVYVGQGIKFSAEPFTPVAPQVLQKEFANDEDAGDDAWEDKEEPDVVDDTTVAEEDEGEDD